MKKVYIKEEQIQFICPVTNKVILDLDGEGDFNPSDAMLFCYVESVGEFMDDSIWATKQLAICLEDLDKNSINNLIQSSQNELSSTEINDKEKYLLSHKIDSLREIN